MQNSPSSRSSYSPSRYSFLMFGIVLACACLVSALASLFPSCPTNSIVVGGECITFRPTIKEQLDASRTMKAIDEEEKALFNSNPTTATRRTQR